MWAQLGHEGVTEEERVNKVVWCRGSHPAKIIPSTWGEGQPGRNEPVAITKGLCVTLRTSDLA